MTTRAEIRAHAHRWAAKGRAEVAHPAHGKVIVPAASKLSAIMCAAEKWKCPWDSILDATVIRGGDDKSGNEMDSRGL